MDAWVEILIIIGLAFLVLLILGLIFEYRKSQDSNHLENPAQRHITEQKSSSKDREKEFAYEYMKARRSIRDDFFRTGRDILKNTVCESMLQGTRKSKNRCGQPSRKYANSSANPNVRFDDYEEI